MTQPQRVEVACGVFEVREVWEIVEPLLPAIEPQTTGRPRVADRVAFNAIVLSCVARARLRGRDGLAAPA